MFLTKEKRPANKKEKFDFFLRFGFSHYEPPRPAEIKKTIKNLSKCSNCQFLIFDNYWGSELEIKSNIICPTCGHKSNT